MTDFRLEYLQFRFELVLKESKEHIMRTDSLTDGQSDGRTVGRTDGRTVGQSDSRTVDQVTIHSRLQVKANDTYALKTT